MSTPLPPELVTLLLEIIGRFPAGASIDDIGAEVNPRPAQRTVSGWLLALESAQEIERIGAGRATRYRLGDRTRVSGAATVPASAPEPTRAVAAAVPVAEPAPPAEDLAEAMMVMVLPTIVGAAMGVTAAQMCLQQHALRNGLSVAEMKAYVARVMARLNTLTGAEAESYGIMQEQYTHWRTYCFPAPQ
jgi:hypothetical protein